MVIEVDKNLNIDDLDDYLEETSEFIRERLEPYGYSFRYYLQDCIKVVVPYDEPEEDDVPWMLTRFSKDQRGKLVTEPNKSNPTEVRIYIDCSQSEGLQVIEDGPNFGISILMISLASAVIYQHIMKKPYSLGDVSQDKLTSALKKTQTYREVNTIDIMMGETIPSGRYQVLLGDDEIYTENSSIMSDVNGLHRCLDCGEVVYARGSFDEDSDIVYPYFRYLVECYFREYICASFVRNYMSYIIQDDIVSISAGYLEETLLRLKGLNKTVKERYKHGWDEVEAKGLELFFEEGGCNIMCDHRSITKLHFASPLGVVGIIGNIARIHALDRELPETFTGSYIRELIDLADSGEKLRDLMGELQFGTEESQRKAAKEVEESFEEVFKSDLKSDLAFLGLEKALFVSII